MGPDISLLWDSDTSLEIERWPSKMLVLTLRVERRHTAGVVFLAQLLALHTCKQLLPQSKPSERVHSWIQRIKMGLFTPFVPYHVSAGQTEIKK